MRMADLFYDAGSGNNSFIYLPFLYVLVVAVGQVQMGPTTFEQEGGDVTHLSRWVEI